MKPVCCVCTGRHHPQACPKAAVIIDQCLAPTPDEYQPPTNVIRLDQHIQRSALSASERSAGRAERHRQRARRHNDSRQQLGKGGAIAGIRLG